MSCSVKKNTSHLSFSCLYWFAGPIFDNRSHLTHECQVLLTLEIISKLVHMVNSFGFNVSDIRLLSYVLGLSLVIRSFILKILPESLSLEIHKRLTFFAWKCIQKKVKSMLLLPFYFILFYFPTLTLSSTVRYRLPL